MSKVNLSHYVSVNVPRCSLTYGVSPCKAQLTRADGTPNGIYAGGAYARRAAGLTGAADSGLGTGSLWIRSFDLSTAGNETLFAGATTLGGTTTRFRIRFVNNQLRITGSNSSGTSVLDIRTGSNLLENKWFHILFSFDLANSARRHIYIDGISNLSVTTFTVGGTIDYTLADWSLGALPDGSELADNLAFAELWFASGVYLDLSVQSNREKFLLNGRPVDLGTTGQTPTGSSPIVFFKNRVEDTWQQNVGGGGGFGTIVNNGDEINTGFGTGGEKCFNTLGTCQDPEDFTDDPQDIFFGEDVNVPPWDTFLADTPIFPFIKAIDFNSAIVSLGDDMGQRGDIKVTMMDAPHNDLPTSLFDKYASERGYDPYTRGTFWGKFRARNNFLRFQPLALFTLRRNDSGGGDDESTIEVRRYIIDTISGPNTNGEFVLTAKDLLKVADGDFAVAPLQSPGFLAADISNTDTTITISPSGILSEYPNDGLATIGGNEIVYYTKSGGDNVDVTGARGIINTDAVSHNAQDRFQLALEYSSQNPANILTDLLQTYAGVDGGVIDTAAWTAECNAYLGTVYNFVITEPTPVNKLISEIIQQIGGAIWWDDVAQQIRLQILRAVPTDAERYNEDNTIARSLHVTEQEDKRVTEVSVYFAQINPTLKVDETRNYASVATVTDDLTEILVGGKSIKTIFARGIESGGRLVAETLANKYLGRYVQPPRRFNFELMKYSGVFPVLGGGYLLGGGNPLNNLGDANQGYWPLHNEFGQRVEVPIQVTRLNPVGMTYQVEAEEMLFTQFGSAIDPHDHTIIFDVSRFDVNLQETHDSLYAEALSGDTVNCYINGGVLIGSSSAGAPAFIVGSFNSGVVVNIFNSGRIEGHGGQGGAGNTAALAAGGVGGTALYTRQNINLTNNAQIWGGGGGGGASGDVTGSSSQGVFGGGGGGGSNPGDAGIGRYGSGGGSYPKDGAAGTTESGGAGASGTFGFKGGAGGDPGNNGSPGIDPSGLNDYHGSGGNAGSAVDGTSFVTYNATGDIRGSQVN